MKLHSKNNNLFENLRNEQYLTWIQDLLECTKLKYLDQRFIQLEKKTSDGVRNGLINPLDALVMLVKNYEKSHGQQLQGSK